MARLTPLFVQSGVYPAELFRRLTGSIWPNGGLIGMAATVQTGTMNVQIASGTAVVPDYLVPGAAYLCPSDGTETVQLPTAPPSGQDRIDLITVQPREAEGDWIYNVVVGTASTSPSVPAVPLGQIAVAQVRVVGGSPTLAPPDLVDRRPSGGLGGLGPGLHGEMYFVVSPNNMPGAETVIPFNNDIGDPGLAQNVGTLQSRFVFPLPGRWLCTFNVAFAPSGTNGTAYAYGRINGGQRRIQAASNFIGGQWGMSLTANKVFRVAQGDYWDAAFAHNQSGALSIQNGPSATWTTVDYLGP